MKTKLWIMGLLSGVLLAGCPKFRGCSDQTSDEKFEKLDKFDDPNPRKAAQNLLNIFKSNRNESSAEALGLKNHKDASGISLGDSLPKLELQCRELLAYDSAKTPDFRSMAGERDVMYRLMEDSLGKPRSRSFVTIRQLGPKETIGKPGHWRPLLAGAAYFMGRIDSTFDSLVPRESRPGAVILMTPALGKVFIGYGKPDSQYVTPVRLSKYADTSCVRWPENGRLPAKQVFAQIAKCYASTVETLCDTTRPVMRKAWWSWWRWR